MLERGGYLPRSRDNWDAKTVFVDGTYQAPETWYGSDGSAFHPGLHYFVGGNSKVYGAALFRLRERDFGELRHKDGDLARLAARLRRVRALLHAGRSAVPRARPARRRPDRAWSSAPYAYPPVKHEPRIQKLNDILQARGSASVPSAARHQAGPEPGRQRHHLQPLHPLRRVRWLSLRDQRQGRRAGDLRRSDAAPRTPTLRC